MIWFKKLQDDLLVDRLVFQSIIHKSLKIIFYPLIRESINLLIDMSKSLKLNTFFFAPSILIDGYYSSMTMYTTNRDISRVYCKYYFCGQ